MHKVQYRTRGNVGDPWSEWRGTGGVGDVYFPRGTYAEFRVARVYAPADRYLGDFGAVYEVLDATVWTGEMNGKKTDRLACKVTSKSGDYLHEFVPVRNLDTYKEMD